MIVELSQKSQITIPKEIITEMGLSEGDKFEVYEKDGNICLMPVVVYPKCYIDELEEEVGEIKEKIKSGEQPAFDTVDDLLSKLEKD